MKFNVWVLLKILAYIAIIMFFLFPIAWIFNMSFMTNEEILRKVPCLLYTSPSPRDAHESRMPSSA